VALGRDGILYADADMANDRPIDTIVDTGVEIQRFFQADAFGVESDQFQELVGGLIHEAGQRAGILMPLYKVTSQGVKKEVRIRRLTPYLGNKQLRFKGGSPGAKLLVEQLREFPNADHDDGPDALEMAIRLLQEAGGQTDDNLGSNLLDAIGGAY
jgi:predicted phage terminase large subunit-like protein